MDLFDAPQVGDDAGIRDLLRRISRLETHLRQVSAAAAGNQSSLDFLLTQSVDAETSPTAERSALDPAVASSGWWPWSLARDAAVVLRTSSTGKLRVDYSGWAVAESRNGASSRVQIGYDIIDADTNVQLVPPDGASAAQVMARSYTAQWTLVAGFATAFDLVQIAGDLDVIVRVRRGWACAPDNTWTPPTGTQAAAWTTQTTRLAVTRLGM